MDQLQQPEIHFHALKLPGAAHVRCGDDMAVSSCAVAMEYRTHLLHLPCHQELTDMQVHWLTSTVAREMSGNVERTNE